MKKIKLPLNAQGMTIIELTVVMAVFMLIIGVSANIFISIVNQQRRILSSQELLSQVSYALEYMSRSIKDGVKDTVGTCLGVGGRIYFLTHPDATSGAYYGIRFLSKDGVCQEFYLDTTDGAVKEVKNGQTPQQILSTKFTVSYLKFILNGNKTLQMVTTSSLFQPRVTIVLDIQNTQVVLGPSLFRVGVAKADVVPPNPGNDGSSSPHRVFQTTVSQSSLNRP